MENKKIDIKQKAVALSYKKEDIAPKVVAKGQGYIAQKILSSAKDTDVPIYEDAELVEELSKIDLGDNIPKELYQVVAQVLVFISDIDKREELKKNAAKY